jgi:2,5-diketo-D-gluconate reductase B
MTVTCYAPLARGELLSDPVLVEVADAHRVSSAQVALKWLIKQPQVAVVPRALQTSEIEEDFDLFAFELTEDEMRTIGELRSRNLRMVDPASRRPVWDVG